MSAVAGVDVSSNPNVCCTIDLVSVGGTMFMFSFGCCRSPRFTRRNRSTGRGVGGWPQERCQTQAIGWLDEGPDAVGGY